jgi:YVTN family beta-propeller protein
MRLETAARAQIELFTPGGQLGLVVSQGPGELWLLDPATDTSIATVKVGDMPQWIAIAGMVRPHM